MIETFLLLADLQRRKLDADSLHDRNALTLWRESVENSRRELEKANLVVIIVEKNHKFQITCDPELIAEALRRLIDNSIRYRREDSKRMIVSVEYHQPYVAGPFTATQVDKGVFWLGQRNLVLGRALAVLPVAAQRPDLVEEFHQSSQALYDAFLASPTAHLDSYPNMCWPADNVTALASLVVHDELYGSCYREAYNHWKAWTLSSSDPLTGLPAGGGHFKTFKYKAGRNGAAHKRPGA